MSIGRICAEVSRASRPCRRASDEDNRLIARPTNQRPTSERRLAAVNANADDNRLLPDKFIAFFFFKSYCVSDPLNNEIRDKHPARRAAG